MSASDSYDVVVVGGGPSGATVAADLAAKGRRVLLLDRDGRIKPCGGAIPPRLVRDFGIPDHLIVARIAGARVVAPSDRSVDMGIDGGYVGMVDRDVFDEWLRERAAAAGAERRTGTFETLSRDPDGTAVVVYRTNASEEPVRLRARSVVGADGAVSLVARQALGAAGKVPYVFAYHEIVRAPAGQGPAYDPQRCDIYYRKDFSPDFYAWIFPHGETASIGTGSMVKGFALRDAVAKLRVATGLDGLETIRREGAPLPLRPLKRWDDGRDVVVTGDAAGVVAPASGEGIYYAMACGRFTAEAVETFLATGDARALRLARKRFMAAHGRVFWVLGLMQRFWYGSEKRRERFVAMCADPDVQRLTWEAYMNKELVRRDPMAHLRVFWKDVLQLVGTVSAWGRRPGHGRTKAG